VAVWRKMSREQRGSAEGIGAGAGCAVHGATRRAPRACSTLLTPSRAPRRYARRAGAGGGHAQHPNALTPRQGRQRVRREASSSLGSAARQVGAAGVPGGSGASLRPAQGPAGAARRGSRSQQKGPHARTFATPGSPGGPCARSARQPWRPRCSRWVWGRGVCSSMARCAGAAPHAAARARRARTGRPLCRKDPVAPAGPVATRCRSSRHEAADLQTRAVGEADAHVAQQDDGAALLQQLGVGPDPATAQGVQEFSRVMAGRPPPLGDRVGAQVRAPARGRAVGVCEREGSVHGRVNEVGVVVQGVCVSESRTQSGTRSARRVGRHGPVNVIDQVPQGGDGAQPHAEPAGARPCPPKRGLPMATPQGNLRGAGGMGAGRRGVWCVGAPRPPQPRRTRARVRRGAMRAGPQAGGRRWVGGCAAGARRPAPWHHGQRGPPQPTFPQRSRAVTCSSSSFTATPRSWLARGRGTPTLFALARGASAASRGPKTTPAAATSTRML
jgi:hypothetical protein